MMMLRSPGSNSTKSSVSQESGVASGSEEEEVKFKEDKREGGKMEEYDIEEGNMGNVGNMGNMEGGKYNVRSERLICQRWWGRTEEAEVLILLQISLFRHLDIFDIYDIYKSTILHDHTEGPMFSMWSACP